MRNDYEAIRPKEAADIIGCSEYKLRDMIRRGEIPHYRTGRKILLRRSTIREWIAQQEAKSIKA